VEGAEKMGESAAERTSEEEVSRMLGGLPNGDIRSDPGFLKPTDVLSSGPLWDRARFEEWAADTGKIKCFGSDSSCRARVFYELLPQTRDLVQLLGSTRFPAYACDEHSEDIPDDFKRPLYGATP